MSISDDTTPILKQVLQTDSPKDSPECFWRWKDSSIDIISSSEIRGESYNGHSVNPRYIGSYAIDALVISLHCLYTIKTSMNAIVKAINYLGDADSTGVITGQMAGAFYGFSSLDQRVMDTVEVWSKQEIQMRAILLSTKMHIQ